MRFSQKLILIMLGFSLGILLLHYFFGESKIMTINFDKYRYEVIDDSGEGGISKVNLIKDNNKAIVNCTITQDKYPWPYCALQIYLSTDGVNGVDLSSYSNINLDIDYQNSDPNTRLRVYLRNSNPAYTRMNDYGSLKNNGVEYAPGFKSGAKNILLSDFQVMTWWLADYEIPLEHAGLEFTNVTVLEISTPAKTENGTFNMVINSIELQGSWIDENTLLKILLYSWFAVITSYFCFEQRRLSRNLQESNQLTQQFVELANRDPLTGARNRHAVKTWLEQVTYLVPQDAQIFSVIYIDIDYFKQINDRLGHQVGDDVLKEFVSLITNLVDITDFFARWGGEEFVILSSCTTVDKAAEKAEYIRNAVEQHSWIHNERLTCSLGVAVMEGKGIVEVIACADRALYKAKVTGRNRVIVLDDVIDTLDECF